MEKTSILNELERIKFRQRSGEKVAIISCHGGRTFTLRTDLAQISIHPGLKVHLLFDGDIYGMEMVHTIVFGSKRCSWRQNQPIVPDANYIGVHMSKIPPGTATINIKERQRQHLEAMKGRNHLKTPSDNTTGHVLLREAQHILEIGKTVEIEAICEPTNVFIAWLL